MWIQTRHRKAQFGIGSEPKTGDEIEIQVSPKSLHFMETTSYSNLTCLLMSFMFDFWNLSTFWSSSHWAPLDISATRWPSRLCKDWWQLELCRGKLGFSLAVKAEEWLYTVKGKDLGVSLASLLRPRICGGGLWGLQHLQCELDTLRCPWITFIFWNAPPWQKGPSLRILLLKWWD